MMKRADLVEKLEEILDALKTGSDEDDNYWDADWGGGEGEGEGYIDVYSGPAPEEVLPEYFSDRLISLATNSASLSEALKDCSLYFYGYEEGSPIEVTLGKNLKAGGYPFAGASAVMERSGVMTRFEVVSNTDLFCYMGGGIGMRRGAPLVMTNTQTCEGGSIYLSTFEIDLTGGL